MSEQETLVPLVETRIESPQPASINDVLKNALDWKQWMADDLRLLIKTKQDEGLSEQSIRALITHHVKTYNLLNVSFGLVTGNPEDKLFDLPELELLQQAIPTLGANHSEQHQDTDIEPMLELTINSLSKDLRTETENPSQDLAQPESSVAEDNQEPIDDQSQATEPEEAPVEPTSTETEQEPVEFESQDVDPEIPEESSVSEDDSKAVSEDSGEQVMENDLKIAENVPVEIVEEKVLVEQPVAEVLIAENQEIAEQAVAVDPIPVFDEEETSTEDMMSKIWDSAMATVGNDIIVNEVNDSHAHINERVSQTEQTA